MKVYCISFLEHFNQDFQLETLILQVGFKKPEGGGGGTQSSVLQR